MLNLFRSSTAVSITAGLFLLMAYLITPKGGIPQSEPDEFSVSITRPERSEKSNTKKPQPIAPKPTEKKLPPPPVIRKTRPQVNTNDRALLVGLPNFSEGFGNFYSSIDRRATPIVRIPPQYPQSPLKNGTEGWVLVEFTISTMGAVEDVKVIGADPPGIFERAVLRAINRWKYQPKIVNEQPVAQYHMRELFRFEIEDA